jgi:signal transduction histidine kinase/DNA-binding NarL/FixJ family response regulator/HPt (histidine-containing phosphotransfer) domain-containing protein
MNSPDINPSPKMSGQDINIRQLGMKLLVLSSFLVIPLIFLVYLNIVKMSEEVASASDQAAAITLMQDIAHYDRDSLNKYYLNKNYTLPASVEKPSAVSLAGQKLYIDNTVSVKYPKLLSVWHTNTIGDNKKQPSNGIWSTVGQFNDFDVTVKSRQKFYSELLSGTHIFVKLGSDLKNEVSIVGRVVPSAIERIYRLSEDLNELFFETSIEQVNPKITQITQDLAFLTDWLLKSKSLIDKDHKLINDITDWVSLSRKLIEQKKMLAFADILSESSAVDIGLNKNFNSVRIKSIEIINQLFVFQIKSLDVLSNELISEKKDIETWRTFIFLMVALLMVLASITGFYLIRNVRYSQSYFKQQNEELEQVIHERVKEIKAAQHKAELLNINLLAEKERAELLATEADVANRSKSLFLASMSHEIRTPLNSIIGGSNILKRSKLDAKQKEILGMVSQSGKTLLELVNDVLDFSKIEADEMCLESVEFDLETIILDLMNMFLLKVGEKNIFLELDFSSECEGKWLGDSTRIKQIVMNLLSNAVKFTHVGGITCAVSLGPKNLIRIAVKDTGIGISESGIKKLFDAFVQSDNSITRQYGGTGLGLSISKRLAELMGGTVRVESEVGKGSSFIFEVKLKKLGAKEFLPNFKTILLLSENDILKSRLEEWGYSVVYGSDLIEADSLTAVVDFASGRRSLNANFDSVFSQYPTDIPKIVLYDFHSGMQSRAPTNHYYFIRYDVSSSVLRKELEISCDKIRWKEWTHSTFSLEPDDSAEFNPDDVQFSGKVLVVEDVEFNQIIATEIMENLGLEIICVDDGSQAVELVAVENFDVIFMDLHMPVMDGYTATKKIREYELSQAKVETPIVAMTADVLSETRPKIMEVGMNDYLSKPFEEAELIRLISKYIQPKTINLKTIKPKEALEVVSGLDNDVKEARLDVMVADADVFDIESLIKRLKNRMDRVELITTSFTSSLGELVEAIQTAKDGNDVDAFLLHSHSLKGSSANIGAKELNQLAGRMESRVKEGGSIADCSELVDLLIPASERFTEVLKRSLDTKS